MDIMIRFLKANKHERAKIFADHCKDPDNFYYHKGGRISYSDSTAKMVCIMRGIRSKKERIVRKTLKKFFTEAIWAGIKISEEARNGRK